MRYDGWNPVPWYEQRGYNVTTMPLAPGERSFINDVTQIGLFDSLPPLSPFYALCLMFTQSAKSLLTIW